MSICRRPNQHTCVQPKALTHDEARSQYGQSIKHWYSELAHCQLQCEDNELPDDWSGLHSAPITAWHAQAQALVRHFFGVPTPSCFALIWFTVWLCSSSTDSVSVCLSAFTCEATGAQSLKSSSAWYSTVNMKEQFKEAVLLTAAGFVAAGCSRKVTSMLSEGSVAVRTAASESDARGSLHPGAPLMLLVDFPAKHIKNHLVEVVSFARQHIFLSLLTHDYCWERKLTRKRCTHLKDS